MSFIKLIAIWIFVWVGDWTWNEGSNICKSSQNITDTAVAVVQVSFWAQVVLQSHAKELSWQKSCHDRIGTVPMPPLLFDDYFSCWIHPFHFWHWLRSTIFVIWILLCNMVLLDFYISPSIWMPHTSAVCFSGKCPLFFFLFYGALTLSQYIEPLGWILMLADNHTLLSLYTYSFTRTGIDSGQSIFIKSGKPLTTAYLHCLKITGYFQVTIN